MPYQDILLIDDDTDDQEIFISALALVSDKVAYTALSNAAEALKKLETCELAPDLIFLDMNMPVMNGHQFLKEVKQKEKLKNIPVIIFSTSSNPSTIQTARSLGAIDFVTKPNRFEELVNILRSII